MVPKKLSSLQHPFVKYCVSLRQDKKTRKEAEKVLLVGTTMVKEYISSKGTVETLFIEEGFTPPFPLNAQELFLVSYDILKKITGVLSPEPVAAIVSMPRYRDLSKVSRLLVLDELADPGNVGTLLRSALALGWNGAYLIGNSCDPYNEKALRSAKGATFHLPLAQGSWDDFMNLIHESSFHVGVADMNGKDVGLYDVKTPFALVLSRESQGARNEAKTRFDTIKVPLNSSIESLNVAAAGAILLYTLRNPL